MKQKTRIELLEKLFKCADKDKVASIFSCALRRQASTNAAKKSKLKKQILETLQNVDKSTVTALDTWTKAKLNNSLKKAKLISGSR